MISGLERWSLPTYGKFAGAVLATLGLGVAIISLVAILFRLPPGSLPAAMTALVVACVASLIGGVPVWLARRAEKPTGAGATLGPMILRLAMVTLLALSVMQRGLVEQGPFLLAMGASYLLFLVPDTLYGVSGRGSL